ncbi:hypothetical protein ACFL1B_01100 [Nanoarchaeota archaeon]
MKGGSVAGITALVLGLISCNGPVQEIIFRGEVDTGAEDKKEVVILKKEYEGDNLYEIRLITKQGALIDPVRSQFESPFHFTGARTLHVNMDELTDLSLTTHDPNQYQDLCQDRQYGFSPEACNAGQD